MQAPIAGDHLVILDVERHSATFVGLQFRPSTGPVSAAAAPGVVAAVHAVVVEAARVVAGVLAAAQTAVAQGTGAAALAAVLVAAAAAQVALAVLRVAALAASAAALHAAALAVLAVPLTHDACAARVACSARAVLLLLPFSYPLVSFSEDYPPSCACARGGYRPLLSSARPFSVRAPSTRPGRSVGTWPWCRWPRWRSARASRGR